MRTLLVLFVPFILYLFMYNRLLENTSTLDSEPHRDDNLDTVPLQDDNLDSDLDAESPHEERDFQGFQPLRIDTRNFNTDEEHYLKMMEENMPNVDVPYMLDGPQIIMRRRFKPKIQCGKFPALTDLEFNNQYWQQESTSQGMFYLLSAYLDVRPESVKSKMLLDDKKSEWSQYQLMNNGTVLGPSVRILFMSLDRPNINMFCQMWFSYTMVVEPVVEITVIENWGEFVKGYYPHLYMATCRIPKKYQHINSPRSVSLVEEKCSSATNMLKVIYNQREEKKEVPQVAVCVKGLLFLGDISVKLAEWFELLSLLGADKIFIYNYHVHPNVSKVLDYYKRKGIVDVRPLSLPGGWPNDKGLANMLLEHRDDISMQNEKIAWNDCLYRNMYRYDYIGVLDTDEVILPLNQGNWPEMIKEIVDKSPKDANFDYISFKNYFFMPEMLAKNQPEPFSDIPPYLHMLQNVFRSQKNTGDTLKKSFSNPQKVKVVFSHEPIRCLETKECQEIKVDSTIFGQLQHYRTSCTSTVSTKDCNEYRNLVVKDTTIWRWKDELLARTTAAIKEMGFIDK